MITLDRCYKLLDSGFSLITAAADKKPNMATWKKYQTEKISKNEFREAYQNITTTKPTEIVGIITGFNNIEVIDVDLKVFKTLQEQEFFWNELLDYIKANIDDFDKKFVVYKTKNKGYHILYRCNKIQGNSKIAKLNDHKECVIESRGVGGYVVVYENRISKLDYIDIQLISEYDREILWNVCKTYNYVIEEIKPEPKVAHEYSKQDVTPWQDYNEQTSIYDVIGPDFKIVRKLAKHDIILRNGATSSQSGYVYRDSGCMYLFSTGTIYPNEQLISPFKAYAFKNHNGNFKEAASELYKKGYGSRKIPAQPEPKELPKINPDDLIFPIDIYPAPIQRYIMECHETLDSSIDYMGSTMLWMTSVILGNSIHIEVKRGWSEPCNIWVAIVGKAGLGKSPSISNIIRPIQKINSKNITQYIKDYKKFNEYEKLTKEEKKSVEEQHKPVKSQFIANDITLEALVDLHEQSKNAVGVFKDELNGWFKDMNKYREGSDLEFWLSTWSGKSVVVNRMTRAGSFVDKPLIPVLGGIQPSILNTFYTDENKDNGFVDRMLLTFPALEIEMYNDNELPLDVVLWYENAMTAFYDHVKRNCIVYDEDMEIVPYPSKLSPEAKTEWIRIFNAITTAQRSDDENEYMKSMLPKQKSYIPRFALLIHSLDCFIHERPFHDMLLISKDAMLKAEKLSKYFIAMAKKIKVNSIEVSELKSVITTNKTKTPKEKFVEMFRSNPELNKVEASELLSVSRTQIYRWVNELKQSG